MIKHLLATLALTVSLMGSANAQVMRAQPQRDNTSPPAPTQMGPSGFSSEAGIAFGNCSHRESINVNFRENMIIISCRFRLSEGQSSGIMGFQLDPQRSPFLASQINESIRFGRENGIVRIAYEDRQVGSGRCPSCYPLVQIGWDDIGQ